ncbi:hypothetical protein KIT90_13100 [Vibrio sp. B172a]|uniref:hypothetical protein n=1 Tax=Vibrio sp. B172a TaxID=2835790 RepID=UPI002556EED5|nr:hypothetical protein [Vibrio sp. B172a]MDK9782319.1 hypothetical protein [Vibrio sp. B172a]
MKLVTKLGIGLTLACPAVSHAIGIDSMIEFSNNNVGEFTITNPAPYRQFIQVGISQLDVENGEIVSTPYSRENIKDWSLSAHPSRTVIDPSLKKVFQIKYSGTPAESKYQDKVYQLSFIPTPYFAEGEPETHSVQVAVGFAPIFIVPAIEDKPIDYEAQYEKGSFRIKNNGETYLRVLVDACSDENKTKNSAESKCSKIIYALSGRDLSFDLTPEMSEAEKLTIELSTHNLMYKRKFSLNLGQVSKE